MPLLQRLLNETDHSNQHTEAAWMYIDCEFFVTEMQVVSFFSYHVSLPFLNLVEKGDQSRLLEIFPKLYRDLKEGKTDTLHDYLVPYHRMQVKPLTEPVQLQILQ